MRAPIAAIVLATGLGVAGLLSLGAHAASSPSVVTVTFPASTIDFKPGPNLAAAQANCLICHGADYVYNQPPLSKAQWTGEVNKMRNAYKAPIADADVDKIVEYLMSQNGKT
jgi:mono/diheme cytochrome c family protein